MKKTLLIGATGLWLVAASVLLTRWWLHNPGVLPRLPESFWVWLMGLYGAQSYEDVADLQRWVGFTLSLIFVSLLTVIGWALWHRIQKKR